MTAAEGRIIPTRTELTNLYEKQEKLDRHILNRHYPAGVDEDLLELKLYALLTEIGEALNEFRAFKFWSMDRARREEQMLPELIDILHFLLTISLEIGVYKPEIYRLQETDQPLRAFGEMYLKANSLLMFKLYDIKLDRHAVEILFAAFYQLTAALGYSWHDIELAYNRKNEENHTRQETAY